MLDSNTQSLRLRDARELLEALTTATQWMSYVSRKFGPESSEADTAEAEIERLSNEILAMVAG
jgi:hypothetical protein